MQRTTVSVDKRRLRGIPSSNRKACYWKYGGGDTIDHFKVFRL